MKKRIKVCFISRYSYPLFNQQIKSVFGGAEVQLYLIGKKLNEDPEFIVNFVVNDYGQKMREKNSGITLLKIVNKHSVINGCESFLGKIIRKFKKWYFNFITAFWFVISKPDIIFFRGADSKLSFYRWISWLTGSKLVFMLAHETNCSGEYEKQNGARKGEKYRFGLTRADLIIAQNIEQQRTLKKNYGLDSIIFSSVYNIGELDKKNGEYVLWAGRCEDWKRPELFIDLAEKNPSEKFVIITPPVSGKERYCEEIKKRCSLLSNIRYHSLVPFNEINDYFEKAKLFVITSRYEGFPNTLIQAAKNKTAILSLSINPNGIFDNYDIGGFADGDKNIFFEIFLKLISDQKMLLEKGEAAYRYAQECHDINKGVIILKNILRQLVS